MRWRGRRRRRNRRRSRRRRRRRRVVGGSGAISGFVYGRADSHPSLQRADRQTLSLRGVTIIPVIVIVIVNRIIIVVVVPGVHIIHQCSHACHGWRDGRGARRGTRNLPLPTYSSHFSSPLIFYSHFWNVFFFMKYIAGNHFLVIPVLIFSFFLWNILQGPPTFFLAYLHY